jgi:sugar O-acyltransferase (sialic acid O-acetyltransferase NeuD family)
MALAGLKRVAHNGLASLTRLSAPLSAARALVTDPLSIAADSGVAELLILGAGGNSREIAEAAQDLGWRVVGFLDDDSAKWGSCIDGLRVLGPIAMAREMETPCICTLASHRRLPLRRSVVEKLNLPAHRWSTILHPAAHITRSAAVAAGSVVLPAAFIGAGCRIGEQVMLLQGACISHDCVVESYSTIASGACLAGSVHVGAGAYIGMGSKLLNDIKVGAGAIVGMGSIVTRDVPDNGVVRGEPARNRSIRSGGVSAGPAGDAS